MLGARKTHPPVTECPGKQRTFKLDIVERSNKAKSWFFEKTNKINFCNDLSVKNRKEDIDK